MDGGPGEDQGKSGSGETYRGRRWTEIHSGLRYSRFTGIDGGGKPSIFFRVEPPSGAELPQGVYEIMTEMKHLDPVAGHGRKGRPTGLVFKRDKRYGPVWRVADDTTGRLVADILDVRLRALARAIEDDKSNSR